MFADTNGWDLEIQIVAGIVSLITLGLIPILMRRNTNQHKTGQNERSEQTLLLQTLIENQGYIKGTVEEIRADVGEVKKVNEGLATMQAELSEKVEEHGREIKGIRRIISAD
jgi:hypothetical protein